MVSGVVVADMVPVSAGMAMVAAAVVVALVITFSARLTKSRGPRHPDRRRPCRHTPPHRPHAYALSPPPVCRPKYSTTAASCRIHLRPNSSGHYSLAASPREVVTTASKWWRPGARSHNVARRAAETEAQSVLPLGFKAGMCTFAFTPVEAPHLPSSMNLCIIAADKPISSVAAVATLNAFPGGPVQVLRRRMLDPSLKAQAIVINNKVSNVFPGGASGSSADSETVCAAVASALGLQGGGQSVLPASTGVIGWRLPVQDMCEHVPQAVQALQSASIMPVAQGMMTTDRWAKARSITLSCGARITAIAKGAGMIEPNMATMLAFMLTDADVPRDALQQMLSECVDTSFNSVSVDSDTSTSDMVVCLASGEVPTWGAQDNRSEFRQAMETVMRDLAVDVVRNGEGVSHVIQVSVTGRGTLSEAGTRRIAKAVVNSPLVKCAVSGNDPNVGRVLAAVGKAVALEDDSQGFDPHRASLTVCGEVVFSDGMFAMDGDKEIRLSQAMQVAVLDEEADTPAHERVVEIGLDMGMGGEARPVVVWGGDLTKEYVSVNADYRS